MISLFCIHQIRAVYQIFKYKPVAYLLLTNIYMISNSDQKLWAGTLGHNYKLDTCCVCYQTFGSDISRMLNCIWCKLRVHKDCYMERNEENILINERGFLCQRCRFVKENNLSFPAVQCVFCPNLFGVIKMFHYQKLPSKIWWAHILCAQMIPEIKIKYNRIKSKDASTLQLIIESTQLLEKRSKAKCYICQGSKGFAIDCEWKNKKTGEKCQKGFHATCGVNQRLVCYYKGIQALALRDQRYNNANCKFHLVEMLKGLSKEKEVMKGEMGWGLQRNIEQMLVYFKNEIVRIISMSKVKQEPKGSSKVKDTERASKTRTIESLERSEHKSVSQEDEKRQGRNKRVNQNTESKAPEREYNTRQKSKDRVECDRVVKMEQETPLRLHGKTRGNSRALREQELKQERMREMNRDREAKKNKFREAERVQQQKQKEREKQKEKLRERQREREREIEHEREKEREKQKQKQKQKQKKKKNKSGKKNSTSKLNHSQTSFKSQQKQRLSEQNQKMRQNRFSKREQMRMQAEREEKKALDKKKNGMKSRNDIEEQKQKQRSQTQKGKEREKEKEREREIERSREKQREKAKRIEKQRERERQRQREREKQREAQLLKQRQRQKERELSQQRKRQKKKNKRHQKRRSTLQKTAKERQQQDRQEEERRIEKEKQRESLEKLKEKMLLSEEQQRSKIKRISQQSYIVEAHWVPEQMEIEIEQQNVPEGEQVDVAPADVDVAVADVEDVEIPNVADVDVPMEAEVQEISEVPEVPGIQESIPDIMMEPSEQVNFSPISKDNLFFFAEDVVMPVAQSLFQIHQESTPCQSLHKHMKWSLSESVKGASFAIRSKTRQITVSEPIINGFGAKYVPSLFFFGEQSTEYNYLYKDPVPNNAQFPIALHYHQLLINEASEQG